MKQSINIKEIREVVSRFGSDAIDECMLLVMAGKTNPCYLKAEAEEMMNVLAKAAFIRTQMENGSSQPEAMRELGNRMRLIQGADNA